jgi:hypothetical protein
VTKAARPVRAAKIVGILCFVLEIQKYCEGRGIDRFIYPLYGKIVDF